MGIINQEFRLALIADAKERHIQRTKRQIRHSDLRRKFGISVDDFEHMKMEQGGKCAICGKIPKEKHGLGVDHDHRNGVIRKLLCPKCNAMLGMANDKIEILQIAIDYLKAHQTYQPE